MNDAKRLKEARAHTDRVFAITQQIRENAVLRYLHHQREKMKAEGIEPAKKNDDSN